MTTAEDDRKYAEQTALIKRRYDPVMTEPIPARMYLKSPPWIDYARAAVVFGAGVAIGLAMPDFKQTSPLTPAAQQLPIRAARAHVVYSPEVRHPVEVGAAEEAHLVQWLTKRLGANVRAPTLSALGWKLVGGRLLPDRGLPAAQFMYEDGTGRRLTLYMRKETGLNNTAFQFAERDGFAAFYWVDRPLAYAIAGRLAREELMALANAIYGQLERR